NELAAALGVPPEAIKEQRKSLKLARGVDYDLVKNNVVFSDEGMKKIVEALAVPAPAPEPAAPAAAEDSAANEAEKNPPDADQEQPPAPPAPPEKPAEGD